MARLRGELDDAASDLTATSLGLAVAGYQDRVYEVVDGSLSFTGGRASATLLDSQGATRWSWLHQNEGTEATAILPSAGPGAWVAGNDTLLDGSHSFLARIDPDGNERIVLEVPGARRVVGLHRTGPNSVLIVGDNRTGNGYPEPYAASTIFIVRLDEDGL